MNPGLLHGLSENRAAIVWPSRYFFSAWVTFFSGSTQAFPAL